MPKVILNQNKIVPDVIAPNLRLLFCGINPGIYSSKTGNHFAHPSNRFWKTLFDSGLTKELLHPSEKEKLLAYGLGIINLVDRPSATASEVTKIELLRGAQILEKKLKKYNPDWVAILGIQAFKIAFEVKEVSVGKQNFQIGSTCVWLLPNPSGLNAHFTPQKLLDLFVELKKTIKTNTY